MVYCVIIQPYRIIKIIEYLHIINNGLEREKETQKDRIKIENFIDYTWCCHSNCHRHVGLLVFETPLDKLVSEN